MPGSENVSLGRVLQAVLEALAQLIRIFENNGGDQIFQEYAASSLVIGRLVRIVSDTETGVAAEICRGKVLAVNRDLSLQLEGMDSTVPSGRLHLLN